MREVGPGLSPPKQPDVTPPWHLKFCTDPAAARRLRHEAAVPDRVMRAGRHPGVVPLLWTYLADDPPCLEYELVAGGTLADLAARIRDALARRKGVEEKRMFGGVGFLLHGNLLVGVWKDSLIIRLGPEQGEGALLEPHVRAFDITGRPMTGWVLVEAEGIEGDDQLTGWIDRATAFVEKLPRK